MPLLIRDIQYSQTQTKSHAEAARYLNTSFSTYKRYAQAYGLYENAHKNPSGKGISKKKTKGYFGLQDIMAGKHPNYDRTKFRDRLIAAGILSHSCGVCGHSNHRPDGRGPYTLDYKDGDRTNLAQDNLQLICYNCYYLTNGRVSLEKILQEPPTPPIYQQDYNDTLGENELEALRDEFIARQQE